MIKSKFKKIVQLVYRVILFNSCLLVMGSRLSNAQHVHSGNKQVAVTSTPYTWKSVPIGGGGFVDGIIFHPKAKGVRYCRTDMGGAYRWNEVAEKWEPILDWISYEDRNLMGVESIALDPNDPNFVILACGTYTNPRTGNGAILRSIDRGKTFQRTNVPFKFGGNENGRGNGERLTVDPSNSNIIFLGTRHNGLWRSEDRGRTWKPVLNFPDVTEQPPAGLDSIQKWRWLRQDAGSGIIFVLVDEGRASERQKNSTIYVGVSLMGRDNLFRSRNGGKTWEPVPDHPALYRPTHAVLAHNGFLYLTYGDNPGPAKMSNGSVWKFNTGTGEWTDITPDRPDPAQNRTFGYAAVSVGSQNPEHLVVSTYNRYQAGGEELFRSTDGGKTWKALLKSGSTFDHSLFPYIARTGVHWMFDIEIDPFDPGHALFTTGYGGHETYNLTDADKEKKVVWTVMNKGIEETVALELLSPPKGAHLISAIGDYGGFVHRDLNKAAPEGNFFNPHFGNTDGVACAELNPDIIVRVGVASHQVPGKNIGYSLDAGNSWQSTVTMPQANSQHGHIAVSADGGTWVWTPQRSVVYVTHDKGETWIKAKGIAENLRVIADRFNPSKFYALSLFERKIFISTDKGNSFTEQVLPQNVKVPVSRMADRGDVRGGQDRIYATPGKEGDLWLAAFDGLYHIKNINKPFEKMKDINEIHAFGFGKAAPNGSSAALYLVGMVKGIRGIFRSDDEAKSWIRINDDQYQWGLILHATGDPKVWGRVYVGTHGRGILWGEVNNE